MLRLLPFDPRLATVLALMALVGCMPNPPDGNGNDNGGNTNGNDNGGPTVVVLELGETGEFGEGITTIVANTDVFDITDQLPQEDPESGTISLDAADIVVLPPADMSGGTADDGADMSDGTAGDMSMGTAGDMSMGTADDGGEPLDADIQLFVFWSRPDAADPCGGFPASNSFTITVRDGLVEEVIEGETALDDAVFEVVREGTFGLCLIASADRELRLTIERLRINLAPPGEIIAEGCADILALPEVQAAITELSSNGIEFAVPAGASVPVLEGTYALTQVTTFDPDDVNMGDRQEGSVTLQSQTQTTIERTGFNATIEQFLQGDASSVGFCTLQRTENPACDQTIARLESLDIDPETGDLEGGFLAVAVRRHAFTNPACGERGDFIAGTLVLEAESTAPKLVNVRGKISLPEGFTPTLIVVPPVQGNGTVTDIDSPAALQFETVAPFSTRIVPLPPTNAAAGFSALGMSPDGLRLAVVTDVPDTAVTYDNRTLDVIRATESPNDSADYIGERVDFNPDGTVLYVPTTDSQFSDRITFLRAEESDFGDEIRRLVTPQGKVPVQARARADGLQLAVLLEANAPIGEAAELSFVDLERVSFQMPPIDLRQDMDQTVAASELVYSPDGELVFVAGIGAVLAVETGPQNTITRIDVSNGAGDDPVALALSNDGRVLAVAVDAVAGDVEFALIDTATLEVIHTQDLPGIDPRGAIGVAHFGTGRVAIVANTTASVAAVQTEPPFTASGPISVADDAELARLGRIVGGGGVIAVTNIDEPAIYLFDLP